MTSTLSLSNGFLTEIRRAFPADFLSQDGETLLAYGKDWTKVYTPCPVAIAFPRTTDEVSRLLKLCSAHQVAVVPSGGRTGLAGGAVATKGELVLSLSKMNEMGAVDELAQTVRVQAGAVTEAVHRHCETYGLTWPIDFASKGSSHVGGNISTNAGGVKVIHYGMTREWVLGLQVVTMAGEVLELNGALEKNNTGLDLRQLFIGSEGTLGVITEATLKLTRLPRGVDTFFFAVEDMAGVFNLFLEARRAPFQLMAYECLTHNCMELVEKRMGLKSPLQERGGAYVLMEVERSDSADAQNSTDEWLAGLFEKGVVKDGTLAQSPRESRAFWAIREGVPEALFLAGLVHKNDIAVPVAELEIFIREMNEMFRNRHSEIELYTFGHIGDGNLHVNAMKPDAMEKESFLKICHEADRGLFDLVKKRRGSVSAEHGIGLLKRKSLAYSRTPEEIAIMRSIKQVMDPAGLLNPGKILIENSSLN